MLRRERRNTCASRTVNRALSFPRSAWERTLGRSASHSWPPRSFRVLCPYRIRTAESASDRAPLPPRPADVRASRAGGSVRRMTRRGPRPAAAGLLPAQPGDGARWGSNARGRRPRGIALPSVSSQRSDRFQLISSIWPRYFTLISRRNTRRTWPKRYGGPAYECSTRSKAARRDGQKKRKPSAGERRAL
jgi:hypothetical protein